MLGAEFVDVNLRAVLGKVARRAGVVKVNVRDQCVADIAQFQIKIGQAEAELLERARRPGFDEDRPARSKNDVRRDGARNAEVMQVDGVDQNSLHQTRTATAALAGAKSQLTQCRCVAVVL